ncbi:MAG: molybdate ABC transporter substrate-binding protein [Rhodospirillales bacterium]|nr:molybdate ABC transporter substrate-binding protein [Rhodospirillales bacterium]
MGSSTIGNQIARLGRVGARAVAAAVLLVLASAPGAPLRAEEAPVVAAAADLQFALADIAAAFRRETGASVTLTFGASGNLARQIRQGAPYQLYLSADEAYVLDLAREGFTRGPGAVYANGRLVVFAPQGSPVAPDGSLDGLRGALNEGRVQAFAIANPEHAPYGARAREALRHAGLWEAVEPHLVYGENVAQAAQFATSGSADGGIFAHALALSPAVGRLGRFALIPAAYHTPLRQRMVLLRPAGATAARFYDYLQQPPAWALLDRYGFARPDPQAGD